MNVLLTGHWDHGGNLVVTGSRMVGDDPVAVKALLSAQDNHDGMAWADAFPTDQHEEAVRTARVTYVTGGADSLIDLAFGGWAL